MLNPGYTVIAKKKKIEREPERSFICPECKKVCLESDPDLDSFRTKCSWCRSWVYGEKILAKSTENH